MQARAGHEEQDLSCLPHLLAGQLLHGPLRSRHLVPRRLLLARHAVQLLPQLCAAGPQGALLLQELAVGLLVPRDLQGQRA